MKRLDKTDAIPFGHEDSPAAQDNERYVSGFKPLSFEQAMARLDEIVAALSSGDAPLDASLGLYAEGAELLAFCEKKLEDAKLKIETLFPAEG